MSSGEPSPAWRVFILLLVCFISTLWFFRAHFFGGFDLYGSSRTNGSIVINILEHWYWVLRGGWSWRDAPWFYPTRGALGYQDGYFGYGLIYSAIRSIGFDRYQASEYTFVTIKVIVVRHRML